MSVDGLRREVDALPGAEWTNWPHAYGKARDTPGHLAALLDGDEQAQAAAAFHFRSAIVHQSTLWPASPDAFAWLVRVLRASSLTDTVLTGCLNALAEAADHLGDIPSDAEVPPLSPAARGWLDRFASAQDTDDEEEWEELWEDFLSSDEQEELYAWGNVRMAALRPSVADLVSELAGDRGEEALAEIENVRRAWSTAS